MSKPSQPCTQTLSLNHSSIVVSLICFFLILSIPITLNEKSQHHYLQLFLLSLRQCHHLQTMHRNGSHCLVDLHFHSCFFPSVTNHLWHSCSPTPPCLHFVPHPSCTLSITLRGWPQVFKLNRSPHPYSSNLQPSTCLTRILTQVFRLVFHRLSFLYESTPLQALFHLRILHCRYVSQRETLIMDTVWFVVLKSIPSNMKIILHALYKK